MPPDISESLRQFVAERANDICEYCRLPQSVALHKHEPNYIIPFGLFIINSTLFARILFSTISFLFKNCYEFTWL